jgi:signal transduction histidine kinase
VLRNLLENAIKFSARVSHPRIEIGACRSDDKALTVAARQRHRF